MGRSSVNRVVQLGLEATKGEKVPADKLLSTLSFDLNVTVDSKEVETQGFKYATDVLVHRVFGEGSFEGPLSYNELPYILAMLYGDGGGGTNTVGSVYEWVVTPNSRGADAFKTFTIEEGDEEAATVMTHAAAIDFEIDFGEPEVTVKGGVLGRTPTTAVALTANPTSVPTSLVTARHLDVYVSPTLASLYDSSNKVTDALKENFKIGKKMKERFVHNTDFESFKEMVELRPDIDFTFSTEHNDQSRILFADAIQSAFRYVGLKATGPEIETGQNNGIELTMACKITPEKREDIDGVYAYGYNCKPIHDDTLGTSHTWKIVNSIASI